MNLAFTIVVGLLAGLVARSVLQQKRGIGIVITTVLSVGGALAAAYGGELLGYFKLGEPLALGAAAVGAVVLLVIGAKLSGH